MYFDLLISLRDGFVHSQTKHKDCAKFGYLPPHSEHPKSTFKGMMTGLLIRLHEQNTDGEDFVRHGTDLFQNMKERGCDTAKLRQYFRHAADRIDYRTENPHLILQQKICRDNRGNLYFPWKAHSDGIPPHILQEKYERILGGVSHHNKMVVAQQRQRNLRDILTSSKMVKLPGGLHISEAFKVLDAAGPS